MQDPLIFGQVNTITFVMVNTSGNEVPGLGQGFTVEVAKGTTPHVAGAGAKAELGYGQYAYTLTAGECDTRGPVTLRVTAPGCVQQNLHYVVGGANAGAVQFAYTLTSSLGGAPIEGATVWVSTDVAGQIVIASGVTDAFGLVRFWLQPGSYYFWRAKTGYVMTNPDLEEVG